MWDPRSGWSAAVFKGAAAGLRRCSGSPIDPLESARYGFDFLLALLMVATIVNQTQVPASKISTYLIVEVLYAPFRDEIVVQLFRELHTAVWIQALGRDGDIRVVFI